MNWNQTGMPSALVDRLGQKREFAEFKTVLNNAQNHVLHPVDVEMMAQELLESGGRNRRHLPSDSRSRRWTVLRNGKSGIGNSARCWVRSC